ncbi:MAG: metallophosphoesterase [Candidatus Azambacteria bacterium]|nr:metallophosphoesterase [Candidatus Azambacteria bacterium]
MNIHIASDLHLEFPENKRWLEKNPLIPSGDILLLAGDIVPDAYKEEANAFYQRVEADFPHIISAMGNHEFYHGEIIQAYPSYENQISPHHIQLNNKTVVLGGIKFVVSVLWSRVSPQNMRQVEESMNDYHVISRTDDSGRQRILRAADTNRYHDLSVQFIQNEVENFSGTIVVLTHHMPSLRLIAPKYTNSPINSGFATDLDDLILSHPNIALWVCGHSHEFADMMIGETRVVRNPLGYLQSGEGEGFQRDFAVEV